MALHGTINHIALTVSDLDDALKFFKPFLKALGYTVTEPAPYNETRLCVNVNESNGIAINIWEAKFEHPFQIYEPGLHHLALNAGSKDQVDEIYSLVKGLGARVLDGPAEFPFAHNGYYALYFLGPDNLKFEVVYMPELDHAGQQMSDKKSMTRKLPPVTPGELLREEFLEPMGISQYRLAKEVKVPAQRIGAIVSGKRSITADTDLRLCRFLGLSNGYWLRAQAAYDTEIAAEEMAGELEHITPWKQTVQTR